MTVTREALEAIIKCTQTDIKLWGERMGVKLNAPYPADAPCYYCRHAETKIGCDYCINNADNRLIELLEGWTNE